MTVASASDGAGYLSRPGGGSLAEVVDIILAVCDLHGLEDAVGVLDTWLNARE